ncbi:hypothetical protein FG386_000937 [Cryptosporidium ryanae]|uniref:uncharacterized protein n=1 Tax=Cryptosporidium ryanae TaxID=515981 RepID=UPI00351A30D7|nr:hypothetical protein FG386_000937 [Cryptosporidium ryanae]
MSKSLFDFKTYMLPEVLVEKENEKPKHSNNPYENYTLIELLLNSLNYKVVEINLVNGTTVKGTLEYRKVMLNHIQYELINKKKLKMIILKDCKIYRRNNKCVNPNVKFLFVPINSISSLTSPEIEDPLRHLRSHLKKSILKIK